MMETYPKMNEQIIGLLELNGDPISRYAALRIRELEKKLAEAENESEALGSAKLRAEKLEKALERACLEVVDHDCPHDFGTAEWPECRECLRMEEERYDIQRDINCWKKYFLEEAD